VQTELTFIGEPFLEFGRKQRSANPKTGLYFFGPPEEQSRPRHIKIGVVGTRDGIKLYGDWAKTINTFINPLIHSSANHVAFPGFNAVFGASLGDRPELEVEVSSSKLAGAIRTGRRHEAIKNAVSIYEDAIRGTLEEDASVDVWFVVIPDEIYRYGRPKSVVPKDEAERSRLAISRRRATEILSGAPSLFPDENDAAETFLFEPNFHHQLKARMLDADGVVLQIIRESTISGLMSRELDNPNRRRMQDAASIAWNLSTTLYFKGGGHPWRLANVRPRVCYIGLVFKLFPDSRDSGKKACCGAQMFLDNGEGLVFRTLPGEWYNPVTKQFHLTEEASETLIARIIAAYRARDDQDLPPTELFIHGKTRFNEAEYRGFCKGAPGVKVTTVRVSETGDVRLYAPRDTPVIRGTALRVDDRRGYLWTRGLIADLGTYPGREVPRPLSVEVVNGETDLSVVMEDLLMLTKLNFNACIYGDGSPVTLRFADAVGEIITAVPERLSAQANIPLPFKRYI
jgi:hypothetical protein